MSMKKSDLPMEVAQALSPAQARALFPDEQEAQAALRVALRNVPVLNAVPVLKDGYEVPHHLAVLADIYERAFKAARGEGPPVRAMVSAPSQVGKTTLGQVAYVKWLSDAPQDTIAFITYGQDLANIKSGEMRRMAREIGVPLREDTTAKDYWLTEDGGGLLARGLTGGITGQSGLRCLDLDDLYRNRADADSAARRRAIEEETRSSVLSRAHPYTSIILKMARWGVDDLIGKFERDFAGSWEVHNIPAVGEDGEPIVTLGNRTKEWWATQRKEMGEHAWWSLMMGKPRPREGRLFRGVTTYREAPSVSSPAIGIDFAYSTKTTSDYSVIVVLTRTDRQVYVRDVIRMQQPAPIFGAAIKAAKLRWPGPCRAYIGGTERGTADWLARDGITIQAMPATGDKWDRAQGAAAAWNAGEILVPEAAPWLDAFVSEVLDFNPSAAHDDQVDALVAAFDALARGGSSESTIVVPSSPSLWAPKNRGRSGPW